MQKNQKLKTTDDILSVKNYIVAYIDAGTKSHEFPMTYAKRFLCKELVVREDTHTSVLELLKEYFEFTGNENKTIPIHTLRSFAKRQIVIEAIEDLISFSKEEGKNAYLACKEAKSDRQIGLFNHSYNHLVELSYKTELLIDLSSEISEKSVKVAEINQMIEDYTPLD